MMEEAGTYRCSAEPSYFRIRDRDLTLCIITYYLPKLNQVKGMKAARPRASSRLKTLELPPDACRAIFLSHSGTPTCHCAHIRLAAHVLRSASSGFHPDEVRRRVTFTVAKLCWLERKERGKKRKKREWQGPSPARLRKYV
jgi:hypothetical protein